MQRQQYTSWGSKRLNWSGQVGVADLGLVFCVLALVVVSSIGLTQVVKSLFKVEVKWAENWRLSDLYPEEHAKRLVLVPFQGVFVVNPSDHVQLTAVSRHDQAPSEERDDRGSNTLNDSAECYPFPIGVAWLVLWLCSGYALAGLAGYWWDAKRRLALALLAGGLFCGAVGPWTVFFGGLPIC